MATGGPMARHSSHILDLARKGAEHKYRELKDELADLVKEFPHLAKQTGGVVSRGASRRGRTVVAAAGGDGSLKRVRRRLSAKARKAISEAQKKRWATLKAAAADSVPATSRKAAKKR
jgi:hypothetical protein